MANGSDEAILSPVELATLMNVERMLESVIDLLDAQRVRSAVVSSQRVDGVPLISAGPVECPTCLQVNKEQQIRDGRCFVCNTPLR